MIPRILTPILTAQLTQKPTAHHETHGPTTGAGQKLTDRFSRTYLTAQLTPLTAIKEPPGQKPTHNSRTKLTHPLSLKREEGVRPRPTHQHHTHHPANRPTTKPEERPAR